MFTTEGSADAFPVGAEEEVRRLLAEEAPIEATRALTAFTVRKTHEARLLCHGRVRVAFEKRERLKTTPTTEGQCL